MIYRVARSSVTAKILAAANSNYVLLHLQELSKELHYTHATVIITDFEIAFIISTCTCNPCESKSSDALAPIKKAFPFKLFSPIRCCPGLHLAVRALTVNNCTAALHLNCVLRDGIYSSHPSKILRLPKDLFVFSS